MDRYNHTDRGTTNAIMNGYQIKNWAKNLKMS